MCLDIVTMGLTVCDVLVKPVTPELFQRDSMPVKIDFKPGGDACNVALNAAALGMRTGLVTVLGDDANGTFLTRYLAEHAVDVSGIKTSSQCSTGTSIVMVEPNGERHFLADTNIFQELEPAQITRQLLTGAKVLSLNSCYRLPRLDDGGVVPVFQMAHELGVLTAMDTTWNRKGDWLERIESALYHTDLFLPSYAEAVQITGEKDVRAMRQFFQRYGIRILSVKMGSEGAYVTDFQNEYMIPPFPVEHVADTVGAGDSYVAGFLTAQVKGMDLYESAVFASAVASFTVLVKGAVGGVPPMEEVEAFIRKTAI